MPETNAAISTNGEADRVVQQPTTPAPVEPGKGPATDADHRKAEGGEDEPRGAGKPWPALDYSQKHDAVEAELLERMRAKYGTTLVSDMDDAQLLLSYVTRNGLQEDRKVSDDVIQTLIASREHMRSFTFNSEKEEVKFRKSCGVIAKAAEPVTAVSLRDSLTTEPYRRWLVMDAKPMPVAEIACRRYRALAFLVLVALLIVQIYWTAVSSILTKTDSLISELNKAPDEGVLPRPGSRAHRRLEAGDAAEQRGAGHVLHHLAGERAGLDHATHAGRSEGGQIAAHPGRAEFEGR